jgi:DNA-directed RNA polymerase subunit M/transcription elongation factor TFIIS
MNLPVERQTIQNAIANICNENIAWKELPQDTKNTYIRRLERGCMELAQMECINAGIDRFFTNKKFVDRYSTICAKLLANLNNEYLIDLIISDTMDVNDVASLESKEMCPNASREIRKNIELRQNQQLNIKVSTAYTCRKCQKNQTIYQPFQSKAGDESENISLKCINCQNVWGIG